MAILEPSADAAPELSEAFFVIVQLDVLIVVDVHTTTALLLLMVVMVAMLLMALSRAERVLMVTMAIAARVDVRRDLVLSAQRFAPHFFRRHAQRLSRQSAQFEQFTNT